MAPDSVVGTPMVRAVPSQVPARVPQGLSGPPPKDGLPCPLTPQTLTMMCPLLTSGSPGLGTVPGKEVELTGICPVLRPSRFWLRAMSALVRLSQLAWMALLAWSLTVHIPQKSSPSTAARPGVLIQSTTHAVPNPTPSGPHHSLGYNPHL